MAAIVSSIRESSGYQKQPDYQIEFLPSDRRVRVVVGDQVLADSERAMILRETRLSPVFYLPREDLRFDLMEPSPHRTYCPFKGTASYWHLKIGGRLIENAAWSYEDPMEEAAAIAGYIAFYDTKIDAFLTEARDGEARDGKARELSISPGHEAGEAANPYLDWLLREAWEASDASELVVRFAQSLIECGFPLFRFNLLLGTLNPQVAGTAYIWKRGQTTLDERKLLHSRANSPIFLNSPLIPIYRGEGGVRRRLESADAVLDFPILHDLKAEGATDYVALPLHFSDGHINALTLTTDRPGGFTTEDLGQLHEILPLLSRLFEVHALKSTTRSVMETYLGTRTADMVLNGRVKRGDGTVIPAVVWSCDLRSSTELAADLPQDAYLGLLNEFFDCAAGSAMAEGGEVLKFIGDAVLAVFPVEADAFSLEEACRAALAAAAKVQSRLAHFNSAREAAGLAPVEAALALHFGELTYGNVGARDRLDFTVIGPAANEVARLVELCKELGQIVLFTDEIARQAGVAVQALGRHCLRGARESHEIFTIAGDNHSDTSA